MKKTPIKRKRSTPRKWQPTKNEKAMARVICCLRVMGRCEDCGRVTPLVEGHLHHMHGKRRFGWMESDHQQHLWLCAACHHGRHNPKVVPAKAQP